MKCPRCGREMRDDEKFCSGCGYRPSPEEMNGQTPVQPVQERSKAGRIVMAVIGLLLYVGLMFGCQSCVMSGYMTSLMMENGMAADLSEEAIMSQAESLITATSEKMVEILLVSNLLTLLVMCLIFHLGRRSPAERMGVFFVNPFRFITFAVFGTALNVFVSVTISLIPLPPETAEILESQFASLYTNASLPVQIFTVAVVTPIVEELIFRGIGMRKLTAAVGSAGAVIITSLVFGFAHGTVVAVLYACIMGAVFAAMYVRYNSVLPSIAAHAFFNLTSFWLTAVPDGGALVGVYVIAIAMLIWCIYRIFVRYPTFNDILSDRGMRIRPADRTEADIMMRLNAIQRRKDHDLDELSDELEELEKKWNENKKNQKKK